MTWFSKLFKIKKWDTIKTFQGRWTHTPTKKWDQRNPTFLDEDEHYALYEIQYCKDTNELRLNLSGYRPKEHRMYLFVLEVLVTAKDNLQEQ